MEELEGKTLGQKHQRYNTLVQEAVVSQRVGSAEDFNLENNNDIVNLINIDIANHNRDKNYILKVLCCDDMLCVSRAIKQSNWLINDEHYIINPQYLSTNIFPHMSSKAKHKFIKHIRNNLHDEKRAEEFYAYEENPKDAVKWLPRCSLKFIENNVINHVQHIKSTLLRRLCEKSITVLEIYIKSDATYDKREVLQSNMFLLASNTEKYLDLVETLSVYDLPTFNKKATEVLMKNSSNRVTNKFETYCNNIHVPTFIKYLKQANIKDFMLTQAHKMEDNFYYRRFFNLERLIFFIKCMPKDIRFEFVKQVFMDKNIDSKENYSEKETRGINKLREIICIIPHYDINIWYQFAPFDVAFHKVKEMVGTAPNPSYKVSMLEVLLSSAQNNKHERIFLEYFRNTHNHIDYHSKEQIMKQLISRNSFLKYNSDTWAVLDDIFRRKKERKKE